MGRYQKISAVMFLEVMLVDVSVAERVSRWRGQDSWSGIVVLPGLPEAEGHGIFVVGGVDDGY